MSYDISFYICGKFLPPELNSAFGSVCILASRMTMPEAAMNKYRDAITRQYDVGFSRQINSMDAESVAKSVQK